MKKLESLYRSAAALWLLVVLSVTVGGISGCASFRTGPGGDPAVRVLWKVHEQYVAVEKQDRPADGAAPANDHPADVSVDRIRDLLASIEVRTPGNERAVRLFNEDELAILGEQIHAGLATAGPGEDVTFAVIGHHAAFAGLLKQRMITLGRAFCRGGELNMIFGDVLREINDKEDYRLHPFLQGSRKGSGSRDLTLAVRTEKEKSIMKRPDWVIFPVAGPVSTVTRPTAPDTGEGAGMHTKGEKLETPAKQPASTGKRSIEERLMILNDLKTRKLITDEEYRTKRRDILDEI